MLRASLLRLYIPEPRIQQRALHRRPVRLYEYPCPTVVSGAYSIAYRIHRDEAPSYADLMSHITLTVLAVYISDVLYPTELQGHAIKNQDLLVASGVTTLRGSNADALSAADEDVQASLQTQSQAQAQSQSLLPDEEIRARDRELQNITRSIAQLAELFKDLSALVIDQGTLLDSVEYNIEQTAVQVGEAVKELEIATRYVLTSSILIIVPSLRSWIAVPQIVLANMKRHRLRTDNLRSVASWVNHLRACSSRHRASICGFCLGMCIAAGSCRSSFRAPWPYPLSQSSHLLSTCGAASRISFHFLPIFHSLP